MGITTYEFIRQEEGRSKASKVIQEKSQAQIEYEKAERVEHQQLDIKKTKDETPEYLNNTVIAERPTALTLEEWKLVDYEDSDVSQAD